MRHYLVFNKSALQATQIITIIEEVKGFHCVAVLHTLKDILQYKIHCTPELVIINLDDFEFYISDILTKISNSFGFPPKLIGITSSYKTAYEANNLGVGVLIGPDMELASLLPKIKEHQAAVRRTYYCISSYKDFHYIPLKQLLFLRADNRTTDFILQDGKTVCGFNTLKYYSKELPDNFIRVNRSFIVNAHMVRRINYLKKRIQLAGTSDYIPFTKHYLAQVDGIKKILTES